VKSRRIWAWVVLVATTVFALAPLYRSGDVSIPVHHFLHVIMLAGAAFSALLFTVPVALRQGKAIWLVAAVVTPLLAMFLMWPSEYALFERSPLLHAAQHLGLVGLGFVTGYAGQRYASGIGVVASLSLLLMGLLAIGGYGTSPPPQVRSRAPAALAQNQTSVPDAARGASIFAQNCAACHGAHGQGGVGPPLIRESARKNFTQAIIWIKHPKLPMPALYPQTLNERDVRDVAAFVETLK
jgi:mono/diheme cytochrome c family protein